MAKDGIDLDILELVLGEVPARYRKGDKRNMERAAWYKRANAALRALMERKERCAASELVADIATLQARVREVMGRINLPCGRSERPGAPEKGEQL